MNLHTYQRQAFATALESSKTIDYMTLGLCGEAGEVANKVKKLTRDGDTTEARVAIRKEIGDVLWYLAGLATVMNCDLNDIAKHNLENLQARNEKGTIHGAGDNR